MSNASSDVHGVTVISVTVASVCPSPTDVYTDCWLDSVRIKPLSSHLFAFLVQLRLLYYEEKMKMKMSCETR